MTRDAKGRGHVPAGVRDGGQFTTAARPEPQLVLADETSTTCVACGAVGVVDDGGHMVDQAGTITCVENRPDGHVAVGSPGATHPNQVLNLLRRVRRLQLTPDWAAGRVDMRPLLSAAAARLEGTETDPAFLAGVRTVMSSPAWKDGEVNVAPLLAQALDMLAPSDAGQSRDTAAFCGLLAASPLAASPELRLACVTRAGSSQPAGLRLSYTVFDGATRQRQHVELVLDADLSVSTVCAGRPVDSFTGAQVWSRVVQGTAVPSEDARAIVAGLLAGIDQR